MPNIDRSKGQQDRILTIHDEKRRVLNLGAMNLVPPGVGIFDEPTRCYVINEEWAKLVMGMVSWLAEVAPWRDAEDEGYSAILEILRFLQGDNCMKFELRQSPIDPCLLQQSLDNGQSWSTAFDYSLCGISEETQKIINFNVNLQTNITNLQNLYNEYNTFYDGTLESIGHEDLVYGDSDDDARNVAQCSSFNHLVATLAETAIKQFEEKNASITNDLDFSLAVAGLVLAGVGILSVLSGGILLGAFAPVLILAGAGLGATTTLIDDVVGFVNANQVEPFLNEDAKDELVCYLAETFDSTDMTYANFSTMLDSHPLTGDAAVIAEYVKIYLPEPAIYMAFLEKFEEQFAFAKLGIPVDCPCDESDQCWFFPLLNGSPLGVDNGDGTFSSVDTGLSTPHRLHFEWLNFTAGTNEWTFGSIVSGSVQAPNPPPGAVRVWSTADAVGSPVQNSQYVTAQSASPIQGGAIAVMSSTPFTINLSMTGGNEC